MRLHAQGPIGARPLIAERVEVPAPADDELLLRVAACGICRTDLHVIEGELPLRRAPVIPGHQIVGWWRAGRGLRTRIQLGDRVGVAWLRHTAGRASICRSGRENLCEASIYTGYMADGGYAEYAAVARGVCLRDSAPSSATSRPPRCCARGSSGTGP